MRAFLLCGLVASITGLALVACNPNSIGRPCINPNRSAVTGVQLVSPALECPSRLCLETSNTQGIATTPDGGGAETTRSVCTDFCESDGDCSAETTQYCTAGFKCAVVNTIANTPLVCRKVCVCKDDLTTTNSIQPADGGVEVVKPCACGATVKENPSCTGVSM
jgi:hypothetical protein